MQGASLQYANLDSASLQGANLLGANLRGTILTNIVSLQLQQLGGADLSNAMLSGAISWHDQLGQVEELSRNSRTTFFAVLGAWVYSWLTLATTTDSELLINSISSPLPIIQTPVPIAGFYAIAPLILLALYLYLHIYMQKLWLALAALPAFFPDGRSLEEHAYPWLMISLIRSHVPRLRCHRSPFLGLTSVLLIITAWVIVPLTLAGFWLRYLPRSDWLVTCLHVVILIVATCLGAAFYQRTRETLRGIRQIAFPWRERLSSHWFYAICLGFAAMFGIALLVSDGVINGVPAERSATVRTPFHQVLIPRFFRSLGYIPFLDLTDQKLSVKLSGWSGNTDDAGEQVAYVSKARLQFRRLRYANLEGAYLANADLTGVDLRGANLQHADLRYARLWGATLDGAVMHQADLEGANFRATNLNNVILHSTKNLSQRQLSGACSNMESKWLPEGFTIEPCANDKKWPSDFKTRKWPHGW